MPNLLMEGPRPTIIELPYLLRKYGVTEEEFERYAEMDDEGKVEWFDGVLIMRSPTTPRHDDIGTFLSFLMRGYVDTKQLGRLYGASAAKTHLATCRKLAPDLMFVSQAKAGRVTDKIIEGAPDLVVEVLSESTRAYDLDETREAYQQAGVSEIWFVDDEQKRLIIDRRQRGGVYREEVKTKGKVTSRVLSGFWLDVAWLWQDPLPNSFQCLQEILGAA